MFKKLKLLKTLWKLVGKIEKLIKENKENAEKIIGKIKKVLPQATELLDEIKKTFGI